MPNKEPSAWQKLVTLEPALVRGLIVSLFAVVASVLNVSFAQGTVENVINLVISLFALLAAVLIRGAVTPNAKVVVRDDTPLQDEATIAAGKATVSPLYSTQVADAATHTPEEWESH